MEYLVIFLLSGMIYLIYQVVFGTKVLYERARVIDYFPALKSGYCRIYRNGRFIDIPFVDQSETLDINDHVIVCGTVYRVKIISKLY